MSVQSLFSKLNKLRLTSLVIDSQAALHYLSLSLLAVIAFLIRILPARYGIYINEFDPYFQYYATKVIISGIEEKGLLGVFEFFNHKIELTWYPYGVEMGERYYFGVPYLGAFTYLFLRALGLPVSLYDVAVFMPPIIGVITTLIVYKIAERYVQSRYIAMVGALFFTTAFSVLARSDLGWYDTDGLGMAFLVGSIYFFIRGIESSRPSFKALYGVLAGLFTGFLGATWGAHQYPYLAVAIFVLLAIILDLDVKHLEVLYFPFFAVSTIMLLSVPTNGLSYLVGAVAVIQYLAALVLLMRNIVDIKVFTGHLSRIIGLGVFGFIGLIFTVSLLPDIGLKSRQLITVLPFLKEAFVVATTVQEQAGSTFLVFYRDLHVIIPFAIGGFIIVAKRWRDPKYLYLLILSASAAYVANTFVRLSIIFDVFAAVLAAIALKELMGYLVSNLKKGDTNYRVVAFTFVTIFILLSSSMIYLFSIVPMSRTTVSLISHGSPIAQDRVSYDWIEALEWIRNNVAPDEVIASWWDYGYWISFIAERKSLADNGTLNATRIMELAEMFMTTDEDKAIEMLKEMGADYVLVYIGATPVTPDNNDLVMLAGFGEDGKFVAIAKIAGVNSSEFINDAGDGPRLTDAFWETFLGRLIPYEYQSTQPVGAFSVDVYVYSPKYPEAWNLDSLEGEKLVLVFRSSDPAPGEVVIYKIVDGEEEA